MKLATKEMKNFWVYL